MVSNHTHDTSSTTRLKTYYVGAKPTKKLVLPSENISMWVHRQNIIFCESFVGLTKNIRILRLASKCGSVSLWKTDVRFAFFMYHICHWRKLLFVFFIYQVSKIMSFYVSHKTNNFFLKYPFPLALISLSFLHII